MGIRDLIKNGTERSAKGVKSLIDKKTGTFNYDFCNNGDMLPPEMMNESFVQDSEGNITFSKKTCNVYRAVGYWWSGPDFQEYLMSEEHGSKRTALMSGGGALLGLTLDDSFGALVGGLVGRMVGGGTREKVKIKTKERKTPAILFLRNVDTGAEFRLGFLCDKSLNKRIVNEIEFVTV